MKGLWIFLATFLYALPLFAAERACADSALKENLVHISYNYGELGFDASKTTNEISQICQDNAAGCFRRNGGVRTLEVKDKSFNVGRTRCIAPEIWVTYDFSGSAIFITKEYSPCSTRAVFRHELQHFLIWKTSRDWFLRHLQHAMKKMAQDLAFPCPSNTTRCSTNGYRSVKRAVEQVEDSWKKIEEGQHNLLDKVDHSDKDEVNYTVCAPYSLKVDLF
ncbi:MAG: hypothetical protein IKR92_02285 [Alphaproteobacteria bacterium]|nr:hypothetical protein [Alphaproteobacteria bacterium]